MLQKEDSQGTDHSVCYFPKKFDEHQQKYSTVEKEALSLLLAVHFDVYLNITLMPVLVYTNHNPLVFLYKMREHNQRLLRWSLILQEYNLQICNIRGKDNVIANALSRGFDL